MPNVHCDALECILFWSRIREVDRGFETPCWEWTLSVDTAGYGQVVYRGKKWTTHRWWFEHQFPEMTWQPCRKFVLDHLCENRRCVRHIRPSTTRENVMRGLPEGTCRKGHPWTEENTRWHHRKGRAFPHRVCRQCHREQYHRNKKAA